MAKKKDGTPTWLIALTILIIVLFLAFFVLKMNSKDGKVLSSDSSGFNGLSNGGSYFYQTDWKAIYAADLSNPTIKEANKNIFTFLVENFDTIADCNTQDKNPSHCLFVYSILNNREDLCDSLPESQSVRVCDSNGVCTNQNYRYKDACKAHAKLINAYQQSLDKLDYCRAYSNYPYFCITYTALAQKNKEICKQLTTDLNSCMQVYSGIYSS